MRTAVWKFPLVVTDVQNLRMPKGSEVLSVDVQGDELCLWALVPIDADEQVLRTIAIAGTGHKREDITGVGFVGTVLMADGALVFHVFDLGVDWS